MRRISSGLPGEGGNPPVLRENTDRRVNARLFKVRNKLDERLKIVETGSP